MDRRLLLSSGTVLAALWAGAPSPCFAREDSSRGRTILPSAYLSSEALRRIAQAQQVPGLVATLRRVLAGLSTGDTLVLPAGRLLLPSNELGGLGLSLAAGVSLRGAGVSQTTLHVAGEALCRLLVAHDASRAAISAMSLIGNSASNGETVGAGIVVIASPGKILEGLEIRDVELDNFGAPGWLHAIASEDGGIKGLNIVNLRAHSRPGNSKGPELISHNSAAIRLDAFDGAIRDVRISRLEVDADHIKSGLAAYGDVCRLTVDRPVVRNAGTKGAGDNAGAYAVQFYSLDRPMRDLQVLSPKIVNPRSCGIYATLVDGLEVTGGIISGQSDRRDATLPKGAIALNGSRNVRISGTRLTNNEVGLAITSPSGGEAEVNITLENSVLAECRRAGIFARASSAPGRYLGLVVDRCLVEAQGPAIAIRNTAAGAFDRIEIRDSEIDSGNRAVDLYQDRATVPFSAIITGSSLKARLSAVRVRDSDARIAITNSRLSGGAGSPTIDARQIAMLRVEGSSVTGGLSRAALLSRGVKTVELRGNRPI